MSVPETDAKRAVETEERVEEVSSALSARVHDAASAAADADTDQPSAAPSDNQPNQSADVDVDTNANQPNQANQADQEKEKRRRILVALAFLALIAALAVCLYLLVFRGTVDSDPGATITDGAGKTTEEIQAELDEQVRANMMTISIASNITLSEEDGTQKLRINAINSEDNKFAQQFTVYQNGEIVAQTGALDPGLTIEYVDSDGAVAGQATVRVQALNAETHEIHGSPSEVTIEIIASQGGVTK